VTLTPHPFLVPWSWKSRATPLLPLWAVRPLQSLSACTRVHFTFFTPVLAKNAHVVTERETRLTSNTSSSRTATQSWGYKRKGLKFVFYIIIFSFYAWRVHLTFYSFESQPTMIHIRNFIANLNNNIGHYTQFLLTVVDRFLDNIYVLPPPSGSGWNLWISPQTLTSIYETTHCHNTNVCGKQDDQKISLQRTYLGSLFWTKYKVGFNRTAIPLLFHNRGTYCALRRVSVFLHSFCSVINQSLNLWLTRFWLRAESRWHSLADKFYWYNDNDLCIPQLKKINAK